MIFNEADSLTEKGVSFVIVTLTKVIGSAPQEPGAKCIVTTSGIEAGTVGGGKVEAAAIVYAKNILSKSEKSNPTTEVWNLQKDIGMTCGGVVELMFEHFPGNNWSIAIFGAGHVSQALCRVLSPMSCQVSVIDERTDWTDRLVDGVQVISTNDASFAVSKFSNKTFFLCMTKGHAFDVPFLYEIYKQFPGAPYIGTIGSVSKGNAIRVDLEALGASDEFIKNLRIPIGLPIGNNTPEEISISIVAELIQVRDSLS